MVPTVPSPSRRIPSPYGRGDGETLLQPDSIQALPIHARRIRPQFLDGIVLPRRVVEHMDDHVAVILDHPFARLVALDGEAAITPLVHGVVDFFGDGVDLPPAGTGGENEEVIQGRDA